MQVCSDQFWTTQQHPNPQCCRFFFSHTVKICSFTTGTVTLLGLREVLFGPRLCLGLCEVFFWTVTLWRTLLWLYDDVKDFVLRLRDCYGCVTLLRLCEVFFGLWLCEGLCYGCTTMLRTLCCGCVTVTVVWLCYGCVKYFCLTENDAFCGCNWERVTGHQDLVSLRCFIIDCFLLRWFDWNCSTDHMQAITFCSGDLIETGTEHLQVIIFCSGDLIETVAQNMCRESFSVHVIWLCFLIITACAFCLLQTRDSEEFAKLERQVLCSFSNL